MIFRLTLLLLLTALLTKAGQSQVWLSDQKIVAFDRQKNDLFGERIVTNGEYMAVSASREDHDEFGGNFVQNSGAVYLYKRDSTGKWYEIQKLVADTRNENMYFGYSIAMQDDLLVVGAPGENNWGYTQGAGSVYIYRRDSNDVWQYESVLVSSNRTVEDGFGSSLSIDGNLIVVGEPGKEYVTNMGTVLDRAGAAYIFERDTSQNWNFKQKILASDWGEYDGFGGRVSVKNGIVVATAWHEDTDSIGWWPLSKSGSAYIFKEDSMGAWVQSQKIVASDRSYFGMFGWTVTQNDESIFIGARNYGAEGVIYKFNEDSSGVWHETQIIKAPDEKHAAQFADAMACNNENLIVGATQDADPDNNFFRFGSVYVFKKDSQGLFQAQNKFATSEVPYHNDYFGSSVAINGEEIIVGCINEDQDELQSSYRENAGAVYVYTKSGVSGRIFKDYNLNCTLDSNELTFGGIRAVVTPGNYFVQTNGAGYWGIDTLPPGNYVVTMDSTNGWSASCGYSRSFSVVSSDSVTIVPEIAAYANHPCPEPVVDVSMPFMRPCFDDQYIYIRIENKISASGVLSSGSFILTLDTLIVLDTSSGYFNQVGPNSYQFYFSDLNPGQYYSRTLAATVSCEAVLGQTLCMEVEIVSADSCVLDTIPSPPTSIFQACTPTWDGSDLEISAYCRNDSILFKIENKSLNGQGDMQCFSPVRILVDGYPMFYDSIQLMGGDSTFLAFSGDGRTWRLEVDQHTHHPGDSRPSVTIERCGNPTNWTSGWVNKFPQNDYDPMIDIFCGEVTGSYDPNDKTGYPLGLDSSHFIASNQSIEYLIRFQNTGTDTAFNVIIRDTLDFDLDVFSVTNSVSSHPNLFRIYGPRVIEWVFPGIMLPDSNTNEPLSKGFVSFRVDQLPDLSPGTEITNNASIYFDFNDPVITNTYLHTVRFFDEFPIYVNELIVNVEGCDTIQLGSVNYTKSGVYYQTELSSIDTIERKIIYVDIEELQIHIEKEENTLIVDNPGYTYQWVDCSIMEQIEGATNSWYTSDKNGEYAVIVEGVYCADTSKCIEVNKIGLTDSDNVVIYPNPFIDELTLEFNQKYAAIEVYITDAVGELIKMKHYNLTNFCKIEFEGASGVYFIKVIADSEKIGEFKVVKK